MTVTTAADRDPTHVRRIALVDVENLVGGCRCAPGVLSATLDGFDRVAGVGTDDLVFVAAAPRLAIDCGLLRPDVCVRCARGRDSAELRLMRDVPIGFVVARTRELVIGSGDHLFVDYAVAARDGGVHVTIVGRRRSIHHEFWRNGFDVIELDGWDSPADPGTALAA